VLCGALITKDEKIAEQLNATRTVSLSLLHSLPLPSLKSEEGETKRRGGREEGEKRRKRRTCRFLLTSYG